MIPHWLTPKKERWGSNVVWVWVDKEGEKMSVLDSSCLSHWMASLLVQSCILVQVWTYCAGMRGPIITGVMSNDHIWTYQSAQWVERQAAVSWRTWECPQLSSLYLSVEEHHSTLMKGFYQLHNRIKPHLFFEHLDYSIYLAIWIVQSASQLWQPWSLQCQVQAHQNTCLVSRLQSRYHVQW